jgi:hypothetical protein
MVEMFFVETLMTPSKLHILNSCDGVNDNQVQDMGQCMASFVDKGIGLSIISWSMWFFFFQHFPTRTWKPVYRLFLINVLDNHICGLGVA